MSPDPHVYLFPSLCLSTPHWPLKETFSDSDRSVGGTGRSSGLPPQLDTPHPPAQASSPFLAAGLCLDSWVGQRLSFWGCMEKVDVGSHLHSGWDPPEVRGLGRAVEFGRPGLAPCCSAKCRTGGNGQAHFCVWPLNTVVGGSIGGLLILILPQPCLD